MPLPERNLAWPPKDTDVPRAYMEEWGAWWAGDPDQLATVYGSGYGTATVRPSQRAGGVVGSLARWFWGVPPPVGQRPARLHVPLASDMAATNADLLFGEVPDLATVHKQSGERLDYLMTEGGMHATLLEGAEVCAAYGGVYLRVGWNTAVADYPLVDAIVPDCAAPEWQGQHLVAVTFWRVLSSDDDQRVVRHLERHEPGRVFHGVYVGSSDRLGRAVPLADYPETEYLAEMVDADGGIATGATGLAVVYVPNMRPNRLMRGSALGRSDFSGVEPLMDALDESWSSWMRDLRLAKARLVVADSLLEDRGRGRGASFDLDQELFSPVNGLQGERDGFGDMLTPIQFAIRVEEHSRTCRELSEQIIRGGGYSAQTFGENRDLAITATEVQARERRTYSTRARKIGYWQAGLGRLAEVLLEIDQHVFDSGVVPERPTLVWPDGVQESMLTVAQTVQALETARAASTEVKVRMVHQDWDDDQVQAEVALIHGEQPNPSLIPAPTDPQELQDPVRVPEPQQ